MEDGNYWIDDDGFIAHGKGDDYITVSGEIVPLHVAPLKAILESHADLLAACKDMAEILLAIESARALTVDERNRLIAAEQAIAKAEKGV